MSRPLGSTTESFFLSSRWDFYHLEHSLIRSRHSSKFWMGWKRGSCMSTEKWRNLRILKVSAMLAATSLDQCKSLFPVYTGLLHWFSNTRNTFDPLTSIPEEWELSFVWWLPFSFGLVTRSVCYFKEFYIKRSKQKSRGLKNRQQVDNLILQCFVDTLVSLLFPGGPFWGTAPQSTCLLPHAQHNRGLLSQNLRGRSLESYWLAVCLGC